MGATSRVNEPLLNYSQGTRHNLDQFRSEQTCSWQLSQFRMYAQETVTQLSSQAKGERSSDCEGKYILHCDTARHKERESTPSEFSTPRRGGTSRPQQNAPQGQKRKGANEHFEFATGSMCTRVYGAVWVGRSTCADQRISDMACTMNPTSEIVLAIRSRIVPTSKRRGPPP